MADSATIVLRDLTTGAGRTGLSVKLRRKDDNFASDYKTASEIGGKPGVYEFSDVPFNKYKLWINGNEDNSFGGANGRWWPTSELTELAYLKLDGSNQPTNHMQLGGFRLHNVGDPVSEHDIADRGYNDTRYIKADGSNNGPFVDKTTNQDVDGKKTFSNIIVDVGTNGVNDAKLVIQAATNPPNGGNIGLKAGYQANNRMLFDFQNSEVKVPDPTSPTHAATKQYIDNNFVDKTTAQTVPGQKTMGNLIIDVGTSDINSPRFQIKQQSNPPNGGVVGLKAGYRASNKMLFDFNSGANASEVLIEDLKIKTSASKYIAANPAQNDYVWKKWVQDNFLSIGNTYSTHTIIIDQLVTENVFLKAYSNPQLALTDLEGVPAANNRFTLLFRQPALTNQYTGDIELPDWVNLIGECSIKIAGKFFRTASAETGITAVIQNLTFIMDDSHDLQRIESIDCIFAGGLVDLEKSKFRNCGFYGNTVQSSNNNNIINCFGNYNIAWVTNDNVYSYNFIEGDSY